MKWCCCSASSPLLMPNTTATSWNDVAVVRPRLCSCQTLLSLCLRVYNSIILLSSFDSVRVLNISFACSNYCFLSKVWYVLQYRSVNGFGSRLESTWNSLLKCVHASGEILEDKASDEVIGNWTVEETIEDGKTDGRNREVAVETVQGESIGINDNATVNELDIRCLLLVISALLRTDVYLVWWRRDMHLEHTDAIFWIYYQPQFAEYNDDLCFFSHFVNVKAHVAEICCR